MKLPSTMLNNFNPHQVKSLIANLIGITGVVIAITAVLLTQDQAALLSQLGQDLSQSPLGILISSITSFF